MEFEEFKERRRLARGETCFFFFSPAWVLVGLSVITSFCSAERGHAATESRKLAGIAMGGPPFRVRCLLHDLCGCSQLLLYILLTHVYQHVRGPHVSPAWSRVFTSSQPFLSFTTTNLVHTATRQSTLTRVRPLPQKSIVGRDALRRPFAWERSTERNTL